MRPSPLLRIPDEVKKAAAVGNALVVGASFAGGTPTGWARGRQLARGGYISFEDAMTMRAWFARHRRTSRPNYARWKAATPEQRKKAGKGGWKGAVAWLLWGGDPAYRWILRDDVQDAIVAWGRRRGKRLVERV